MSAGFLIWQRNHNSTTEPYLSRADGSPPTPRILLSTGLLLDFTAGLSWDDELAEMEAAHNTNLPDDLDSFIAALNRSI
jgi:hypothetical protein